MTGEFDISLNAVAVQLNGTPLATLRAAPMVAGVQYQAVYAPQAHDDPDLALVHATKRGPAARAPASRSRSSTRASTSRTRASATAHPGNDGPFTNDRVVFADVFHNKADNQGFTPADENGHGTHVAGTVGCNEHTPAVLDGITVDYDPSGVAPEATLGNFNVFPDDVANARSEDIVNALEKAYSEGFDVANMSLSGASSGADDLLSMAVDNLDQANMVSAVAAGNDGPGFSTVGSPGKAARALTAGAITVGHFIGVTVTDNDEAVITQRLSDSSAVGSGHG